MRKAAWIPIAVGLCLLLVASVTVLIPPQQDMLTVQHEDLWQRDGDWITPPFVARAGDLVWPDLIVSFDEDGTIRLFPAQFTMHPYDLSKSLPTRCFPCHVVIPEDGSYVLAIRSFDPEARELVRAGFPPAFQGSVLVVRPDIYGEYRVPLALAGGLGLAAGLVIQGVDARRMTRIDRQLATVEERLRLARRILAVSPDKASRLLEEGAIPNQLSSDIRILALSLERESRNGTKTLLNDLVPIFQKASRGVAVRPMDLPRLVATLRDLDQTLHFMEENWTQERHALITRLGYSEPQPVK